jgi:hypothetical protein
MAGDLVTCLYVNCRAAPRLEGGRRGEGSRHGRPSDGRGEEEGGGGRWTGSDVGRLPAGEGPGRAVLPLRKQRGCTAAWHGVSHLVSLRGGRQDINPGKS